MASLRNNRQAKMNNDKKMRLKGKAIRQAHKHSGRLSATDMYHLDKGLEQDYFPAE